MDLLILVCLINLTTAEICGKSLKSNDLNRFPWNTEIFSAVNRTAEGRFQHLCGSTIISSNFSITAAHCIQEKHSAYKRSAEDIFLLANVHDMKNWTETVRVTVLKILVHPSWNPNSKVYESDIALLKFRNELDLSVDKVAPLCLWKDVINEPSVSFGEISTFIALEEGDPGYENYQHDDIHNFSKKYFMPIRESCDAQKRFKSIASNNTFCAGGLNSGACLETGSSGSSMAVFVNDTYYLRGIVSASFIDFAGCDNYTFTLFTDVIKYKEWIDDIMLHP